MNKTYLVVWQKAYTHYTTEMFVNKDKSTDTTTVWEPPPDVFPPTGRQETAIDVYYPEGSVAGYVYEMILIALEKAVEYDRKQIIIHGVSLL